MECKERVEARLPHERGAEGFLREPARSEEKDTPNLQNPLGFLRAPRRLHKGKFPRHRTNTLVPVPPTRRADPSE